jgi:salicylate hydroxylase
MFDGTNMQLLKSHISLWKDFESTWGLPMYLAHRVDLHTQLRQLATEKEGLGRPCDVRVRYKVVNYVSNKIILRIRLG